MIKANELDDPNYYKPLSNTSLIECSQSLDRMRFPNRWEALAREISARNIARKDGSYIRSDPNGPKGMGGWLIGFCIFLVLALVANVALIISSIRVIRKSDEMRLPLGFESIMAITVVFACIFILTKLVRLQTGVVSQIKTFLLFLVAVGFITTVLGYFLPVPEDALPIYKSLLSNFKMCLPISIPYSFVWYNYFSKSVRVANTFPETAQL